ncbi:hypothetical protein QCA50_008655 [Cerrena zonata]|uniref:Uncharacterized protein n=1 Tax=Cerrena zonata TaxID=2478898 RepID=A0AAW0GH24_9APHY
MILDPTSAQPLLALQESISMEKLQEPSTVDYSNVPDLSSLRSPSPIQSSPPDINMDLRTPSPIPGFASGASVPDIFNLESPSPIQECLPLPDVASLRLHSPLPTSGPSVPDVFDQASPSPIQDCLLLPDVAPLQSSFVSGPSASDMLGQDSPSPIQDCLPLLDVTTLQQTFPIASFASGPSVSDTFSQESPSPIRDCLPLPDVAPSQSPSSIASFVSGSSVPNILDQESPSPIQECLPLLDIHNLRSPSPISAYHPRSVPSLDELRTLSPAQTFSSVPDASSHPSPSPIQSEHGQSGYSSYLSLDTLSLENHTPREPAVKRSRCPYLVAEPGRPFLLTDINDVSSPSPIASPTSSNDSDEIIYLGTSVPVAEGQLERRVYYTGRTILMMDECDLFFWSIVKHHWFGPNQLLHWRRWAKDHRMTIKLAEDLLDFPHRYPELFKSHMVPICGLPVDDQGRYILPPLQDTEPQLKFTAEIELVTGSPEAPEPQALDDGAIITEQSSADFVDFTRIEYDGLYPAEMKRALFRQHDNFGLPPGEGFVNEWQRHLRSAAGVPELRMLETRCIKPAMVVSNFETPYPDVPPHPSTNLSHKDSELDDNKNLIKVMRELSSAISDLRKCTSEVFGTAHYDRIARQGGN